MTTAGIKQITKLGLANAPAAVAIAAVITANRDVAADVRNARALTAEAKANGFISEYVGLQYGSAHK
jgi:hypothetical protein